MRPFNFDGSPRKLTPVNEERVVKGFLAGASLSELCATHKIGWARLKDILNQSGVFRDRRHDSRPRSGKLQARSKEIAKAYRKGKSLTQLAEEWDISHERVRQLLEQVGVKRRPFGGDQSKYHQQKGASNGKD